MDFPTPLRSRGSGHLDRAQASLPPALATMPYATHTLLRAGIHNDDRRNLRMTDR